MYSKCIIAIKTTLKILSLSFQNNYKCSKCSPAEAFSGSNPFQVKDKMQSGLQAPKISRTSTSAPLRPLPPLPI